MNIGGHGFAGLCRTRTLVSAQIDGDDRIEIFCSEFRILVAERRCLRELRGDLYRQGREIARIYTGDPNGFRPNLALTWGAQPHNGLIYFNDINSGLWIVKLGEKTDKGSTTAPGK